MSSAAALLAGVYLANHFGELGWTQQQCMAEAARREGDILIVTVTADAFVNKGPGRPIFPEMIRAEMLGALSEIVPARSRVNRSTVIASLMVDAVQPSC